MARRLDVVMLVHDAGGVQGASFPDYPGATAVAHDLTTLRDKAAAMLIAHIAGLRASGEPVANPRTLAELQASAAFRHGARTGAVAVLEVWLPDQDAGGFSSLPEHRPAA